MKDSKGFIKLSVVTAFEQCPLVAEEWDEEVTRLGGPVYMTYDWLKTWWEFYGAGRQLRLFDCWYGNQRVALLPIYLETFGFFPFKITVARLVGANIPPKTFNPPVDPDWSAEVFKQVHKRLFEQESCDLFSLGPVSKNWTPAAGLQEAYAGSFANFVLTWEPRGVQTLFVMPPTLEDYFASLGSSERSNRKKKLRQLEKLGPVSTEMVSEPSIVESEFEVFAKHHGDQWQASGMGGHFVAWPRGESYNRTLVQRQGQLRRVRFFKVLAENKVITNQYAYVFGNTLFAELPSRTVGEPWDKLGLGGTAYVKLFEAAIGSGIPVIDAGLGQYDNKIQLGGQTMEVGVWRMSGRGVRGLKAQFFLILAKLVLIVCEKVWYRRLLLKLPTSFRRTQHLWWLRFDA